MSCLNQQLELQKCPHCNVDTPSLTKQWGISTTSHSGINKRDWVIYCCNRCGGLITAGTDRNDLYVTEMYPNTNHVNDSIPQRAKEYLSQALDSLHAPAGAVMLAASAVDSMMINKGYIDGTLYTRINKAAEEHLITKEMAQWAHQIRLDANDQRHADNEAILPNEKDAQKAIEFALSLGEFLFVLPSRVTRGLDETKSTIK